MCTSHYKLHGICVLQCQQDGPQLRTDRDAVRLIGTAAGYRATLIVIPIERFGADFFDLKTKIAGEILQKFVAYGLRVAIIGDVSRYLCESASLRAFVSEVNRGEYVWFLASIEDLKQRLSRRSSPEA